MKTSFILNEIQKIAQKILNDINKKETNTSTVITLSGDLGSGKTTLTQEIAKLLDIKEKIVSPTFVIMKKYKINKGSFKNLVHIDAYRLENSEELLKIGWQELIENKENLIIIEWPERVSDCVKSPVYRVILGHMDEQTRTLETCYN